MGRRLLEHSAIYAVGTLATSLASFLLLPLYVRALTPSEYGTLEVTLTTVILSIRALSLEVHAGLFQRYFLAESDADRRRIVTTAVLFLVPFAAVGSGAFALLAPALSILLFGATSRAEVLELAAAATFFGTVITLPLSLLRAQQRPLLFTMCSFAQFLATIGSTVYFVVVAGLGIEGALLGQIFGTGLVALRLTPVLLKEVRPSFSLRELILLVRFGTPLAVMNLCLFVLNSSDRYFLNAFQGPDVVAVYSLAYKLAGLIAVALVNPFWLVWPTVMLTAQKAPNAPMVYARSLTYTVALGASVLVVITLIAPYAVHILATPAYAGAAQLVPIIAVAYLTYLTYPILATGVLLTSRTEYSAYAAIVAALLNLTLNYLLIPKYGALGAAFATALSYLAVLLGIYRPSRGLYPVPYEWRRVAAVAGLAAVLTAAGGFFTPSNEGLAALWRLGLLAAFPVGLWRARVFDRDEAALARSAAASWLGKLFRGAGESELTQVSRA